MKYKYETHVHTSEASACGKLDGARVAREYYEAGYTGIIITDHFFNGNTCISRDLSWKQRVEEFVKGYENAKNEGEKIGLDVFFGWEAGYDGTEFLIYGLDKEWLIEHDDILDWSVKKQYEMVTQSGGMVVHAHPFREANYIGCIRLYPHCIDAVEVVNSSNDRLNERYNNRAYYYANEYGFPMTGGSDTHYAPLLNGGMEFDFKLNNIHDYIEAIKNRKGKILNFDVEG